MKRVSLKMEGRQNRRRPHPSKVGTFRPTAPPGDSRTPVLNRELLLVRVPGAPHKPDGDCEAARFEVADGKAPPTAFHTGLHNGEPQAVLDSPDGCTQPLAESRR